MLFFFPRDVLDEIWNLVWSVSEGVPTYLFCVAPRATQLSKIENKDVLRLCFPRSRFFLQRVEPK